MIANTMSKDLWSGVTDFPEFKSCRTGNCQLTCVQWEGQKEVCAEEAMREAGMDGMGKNFQGNGCGESIPEGIKRAKRAQNEVGKASLCQALLKCPLNGSLP